jgi:hypothetical protein
LLRNQVPIVGQSMHMHNANYTKEMNSNEEIFQLEIKSKKFHQRGSFHQERSLNTVPIVH